MSDVQKCPKPPHFASSPTYFCPEPCSPGAFGVRKDQALPRIPDSERPRGGHVPATGTARVKAPAFPSGRPPGAGSLDPQSRGESG